MLGNFPFGELLSETEDCLTNQTTLPVHAVKVTENKVYGLRSFRVKVITLTFRSSTLGTGRLTTYISRSPFGCAGVCHVTVIDLGPKILTLGISIPVGPVTQMCLIIDRNDI